MRVRKEPPGPDCIHKGYAAHCAGGDPHGLFLTYLHCLYEANKTSVIVKPQEILFLGSLRVVVEYQLCRLTIHDLSVILCYILSITRISHPINTMLSFVDCFIDDHGIQTLIANITKQAQTFYSHQSTSNGSLILGLSSYECTSTCRGVKALANLITLNSVPLVELRIQCRDFSSLKTLIKAFSSTTAVNFHRLQVSGSNLTSRHRYHLILLLTQAGHLQDFDVSGNPGLHELLLSSARNLKMIKFSSIPIDNQELLEIAQVLQSNTSLIKLHIDSDSFVMRYTFESLDQFVKIVTASESKSQLEVFLFGQLKESKDIVLLSSQLTRMALSRGLSVHPVCLATELTGLYSSIIEQYLMADRMPDSLLYGKE